MHGGEIFVPKIPSSNIMDLVEAVVPGAEVKFTGARPAEKLHELLISSDEARQTLDFPDMYVIQPAHVWWGTGNWSEGKAVPEDFEYASEENPQILGIEALKEMVDKL